MLPSIFIVLGIKISAPTSNCKFESPHRSYSVLDIQDYFKYIIKKQKTLTENPPIRIYVNEEKTELHLKLRQNIT